MLIETLIITVVIALAIFLIVKIGHFIIKVIIVSAIIILILFLVGKYDFIEIPFKKDLFKDTLDRTEIEEKILCISKKGIWTESSTKGYFCNLPSSDADKPCSDSSECEGLCITGDGTKGICQDYEFKKGCFDVLTNGTKTKVCID